MTKKTNHGNLDDELTRLSTKYKGRSSKEIRAEIYSNNGNSYLKGTITYSWGERKCLVKPPEESTQKDYEDLQASRAFWWHHLDVGKEEYLSNIKKSLEDNSLKPTNALRVKELGCLGFLEIMKSIKTVCEIGFRTPELLKYFLKCGAESASGYDVVPFNVMVGKELGYDVKYADIGEKSPDIDLAGMNLVICYQVLEHVTDPLRAISNIFQKMDSGCYFHVEIPIEPGSPRIEWGHLFPFHPGDLEKMCKTAGFKILYQSSKTWKGGPEVRRLFCKKP